MTTPAAPARTRDHAFPPVADARTRVLVLGSLPGRASLAAREYYANPGNGFWRLMGAVTGADLPTLPYAARLEALLARGIGLWDVIAHAERAGSLDSAIRDPAARDLTAMTDALPALEAIAFNGRTAERIGLRQLGEDVARWRVLTLLSSSGACAVPADLKRENWMRLRAFIL
ncbi:DNA-deoxyinosine glycosylase [Sphingosinicella xenopeptidilytica]|uniref:DNA-deoxyinosine glycosylase n=1 Tax=Sphingosinicella xenopeptidilytica TaxID=364098 RepID=A0ABW3C3Y6_SPHXN